MTGINVEIGNSVVSIEVPTSSNDWLIIKDETYRPDRGVLVLETFKKDFPSIQVGDDVEKVYALCSRSARLAEWLAKVNLSYATLQNEPTFYRDVIAADDYKLVAKDLEQLSNNNRSRATEELKAAEVYKTTMETISNKYSNRRLENKFSTIIALNTTSLPLTLQLAIENYTPANDATSPNRRAYARELLVRYKLALIEMVKENRNIDIDRVISEATVK